MRISVNLATRPFVELRPFFLRLRLLMGLLVVVGAGAVVGAHFLQKQVDQAQAQMDVYSTRTLVAQQEKQANERRMRQPANAEVLDRAHFLNALFLRKSFSWTAVMMDLERVLPIGVQVTSIEPQISADGDVVIRLRVSGDRDKTVQLVRNLEGSRRFLHPRLTGESQQAKEGGAQGNPAAANTPAGVEFEILANYNPLPEGQSYAAVKTAAAKSAVGGESSTIRRKNPGIVLKPYVGPQTRVTKPGLGGAR
jgi:type IV pilus assembly protein PilN